MFTLFFTGEDVTDFATAAKGDTILFARHFGNMREKGVMIAPSQFEASFVSLAHTDEDIDATLTAFS